ncbi:MAG: DNA-directed RNA polymerase subunit omega [Candidatus Omnitrophica bacterium]|nr:DNA-directed RNA polymerase subunit omega [Candidatus Omnitrophota bacterium]
MSYVAIQDYLVKTDSIYKLVILASMRATELNAGAARLVEIESEKMTSIALEEIAQEKIKMQVGEQTKKDK